MSDQQQDEALNRGFVELGINHSYVEALAERDIAKPVMIQQLAIPPIAEGHDVIVHSGTGTGKTLAYVLPLLQRINMDSRDLQWLVVVPTQELAMQIVREIESLAGSGKVAALIGGASLQRQIDKLKTHPPIAVGTPGRLVELLKLRKLKLHQVKHLVIDEVDQVFSLGASAEVQLLLGTVPRGKQLVFVTATVTDAVNQTVTKWMNEPVFVLGQSQAEATAGVQHEYVVCDRRDKMDMVRRFIRTVNPAAALIFVKETEVIGELEAKLKFAGLQIESIYGEAGKQERASVMRRFATGKIKLLIATDVAARGIDVTRISHIINYEPPDSPEQYIHRAGRTGRMGRAGTVVTLVTAGERQQLARLTGKAGFELVEKKLSHGNWKEAAPRKQQRPPSHAERNLVSAQAETSQQVKTEKVKQGNGQRVKDAKAQHVSGTPVKDGKAQNSFGRSANQQQAQNQENRGIKLRAPQSELRQSENKQTREPASNKQTIEPASNKKTNRDKPRERDRKNKGAPRWLKEKNNNNSN